MIKNILTEQKIDEFLIATSQMNCVETIEFSYQKGYEQAGNDSVEYRALNLDDAFRYDLDKALKRLNITKKARDRVIEKTLLLPMDIRNALLSVELDKDFVSNMVNI